MEAIAAEFGANKSLYDVLETHSGATAAEIKKAYFKIALKCHPDKCPGDEAAKGRFQALSLVHSVLSDPERRRLYDESGEIDPEDHDDNTQDSEMWSEYWRNLFPKITLAEIEAYGSKFQGSGEEEREVLKAYKSCKGDMSAVMDTVVMASQDDEERFRAMIDRAIDGKKVPAFPALRKKGKSSAKRKAQSAKEAQEADELKAMLGQAEKNRNEASVSTHRARQFDSMVSSLEQRYGGRRAGTEEAKPGKGRKRAKMDDYDIDDAEFQRIQAEMEGRRSKC